jgi:hypothetical protein
VTLEGSRMSVRLMPLPPDAALARQAKLRSFAQFPQNTMAFESKWRLSWTR